MSVFIGTAIAITAALVIGFLQRDSIGIGSILCGTILYMGGSFLVTIWFNVLRNNKLAHLNPTGPEAVPVWHDYLITWTAWNHVRTIASLAVAVSFIARGW